MGKNNRRRTRTKGAIVAPTVMPYLVQMACGNICNPARNYNSEAQEAIYHLNQTVLASSIFLDQFVDKSPRRT